MVTIIVSMVKIVQDFLFVMTVIVFLGIIKCVGKCNNIYINWKYIIYRKIIKWFELQNV
jgi:hypothetical protein